MSRGLCLLLAGGALVALLAAGPATAAPTGYPYPSPPPAPEPQPPPQPTMSTLSVTKDGTGSGTVTSGPVGIDCGTDCSEAYANGTTVTLTATPDAGSMFTGWTGACAGTGACSVPITGSASVTATFVGQQAAGATDTTVGASLISVRAGRGAQRRHVSVELTATEKINAVVSLVRGGNTLVEKRVSFTGGRTVKLGFGSGVGAGPATLQVHMEDAAGNETTLTRRVRLGKP